MNDKQIVTRAQKRALWFALVDLREMETDAHELGQPPEYLEGFADARRAIEFRVKKLERQDGN